MQKRDGESPVDGSPPSASGSEDDAGALNVSGLCLAGWTRGRSMTGWCSADRSSATGSVPPGSPATGSASSGSLNLATGGMCIGSLSTGSRVGDKKASWSETGSCYSDLPRDLPKKKKNWWPGKYDADAAAAAANRPSDSDVLRNELKLMQDTHLAITNSLTYSPPDITDTRKRIMPFDKDFIVINFGTYDAIGDKMIPAEFTVAVFNVRDGLKECYSRLVDPGPPPLGRGLDFHIAAKRFKYPMPPFDPTFSFENDIIEPLEELMRKYPNNPDQEGPPFLYTYEIGADEGRASKCLAYIMEITGRKMEFKLAKLATLVEILLNHGEHLRKLNNYRRALRGQIVVETQAIGLLRDLEYEFIPELGCNYHQLEDNRDGLPFCSMSLVKRWIYNILPLLCRVYSCPRYLHNHIPFYLKVEYAKFSPEQEDRETPDYELPSGVSMESHHEFVAWSDTDATNSRPNSAAQTRDSGPTSGYSPKPLTFKETGFGTHQIYPNLCDYRIAFPAVERSIVVSSGPNTLSNPDSGSIAIVDSDLESLGDRQVPTNDPSSGTNPSSRTLTPGSDGKHSGATGPDTSLDSSTRRPWRPRRSPSPGDPVEFMLPTLGSGRRVPIDPDAARMHRISEYARCLLPTSILDGYAEGTRFCETGTPGMEPPRVETGHGRRLDERRAARYAEQKRREKIGLFGMNLKARKDKDKDKL